MAVKAIYKYCSNAGAKVLTPVVMKSYNFSDRKP
jgi:hypothetical protein